MAGSPVLDAFPKRPLVPVTAPGHSRKRLVGLLIVLLLVLPSAFLFFKVAREDALRSDLRARGAQTSVLSSEGRCTSRRQISGDEPLGCNLTITYRAREEGDQLLTADVWLDGDSPRIFTPDAVYDPVDPSRVMLKPEVDREREPDEFVLALILLALPAFGLLVWFAGGKGRLAKAASNPQPQLVQIDRAVAQQRWVEYWVRPGGLGEPVRSVMPASQRPFLVAPPEEESGDRLWALALLDSRGKPFLLDENLSLLDFTTQERQALRTAACA